MKHSLITLTLPLLLLFGCSGETEREAPDGDTVAITVDDTSSDAQSASRSEPIFPVLSGTYDPEAPSDAALLVGEVRLVDGCIRVGDGPDGGTLVIWPPETTMSVNPEGGVEIRGYRGELLARLGDTIGLSGGKASGTAGLPGELREELERGECGGPYWIAGQFVSREIWDERFLPYLPVIPGEYDPATPAHEALFTGVVHVVNECVRVGKDLPDAPDGMIMIWPAESRLVRVGSGPPAFEVRDYRDSLLVRVGDTIRMGGSSTSDLDRLPGSLRTELEERGCTSENYWISGHPLPKKYW